MPSDPNLTENSWTEEEFEVEEALSPKRMPCMLAMAHPVVQTTCGAGSSTVKEDDKPAYCLLKLGPKPNVLVKRSRSIRN